LKPNEINEIKIKEKIISLIFNLFSIN